MERALRIAYLCHYFLPEPAAPAARVHELSRAWVREGQRVTVLTGFPNFPTGVIPGAYRGRWQATESLDGIRVLRSWVYALPNRAVGERGLNHLSFMASSLVFALPRLGPIDVVIASSPTLFSALSGWALARLHRVPFVLEVRDLWPDAFVDLGVMREGASVRMLRGLARFLYRQAAQIVVVTERFADQLRQQQVPPHKLSVIPNGADLRLFRPGADGAGPRRRLGIPDDAFVAAYVGNHGRAQGLDVLLDAAARQPGVLYLLVGDGAESRHLEREKARRGRVNVRILPSVPKEQVPGLYAAADVCLVPLRDAPVLETFLPSKMFEIMAAARPMVAAVRGEARDLLDRSGGALVVDPGDAPALAAAVERLRLDPVLRDRLGKHGRQFVQAHFDRDVLAHRYLDLLRTVVERA